MDEKIEMSQAMNGEQHLQELLQRITDKAEKMTRRGFSNLMEAPLDCHCCFGHSGRCYCCC